MTFVSPSWLFAIWSCLILLHNDWHFYRNSVVQQKPCTCWQKLATLGLSSSLQISFQELPVCSPPLLEFLSKTLLFYNKRRFCLQKLCLNQEKNIAVLKFSQISSFFFLDQSLQLFENVSRVKAKGSDYS